jgi:hypothetical protein
MLQDLIQTPNVPDQAQSEPAMKSAGRPAAPPDRFATQLMDEIFGDVEDVLDGGFVPPQEAVKVEVPAPEIKFDVAAALAERYPQLAKHLDEGEALPDLPGPTTALSTPQEKAGKQKKEKDPNGLSLVERFMILTGCTSAVAALGIWMTSQGLLGRFGTVLSQQAAPTAPAPVLDATQTKFADYMARSLSAIDRTAGVAPAAPTSALPGVPVAGVPGTGDNKPSSGSSSVGIVLPKPGMATAGSTNLIPNRPITPIAIQPQAGVTNSNAVSRNEFNQVNQMVKKIYNMVDRIKPGTSSRLPSFGTRSAAPVAVAAAPVARPAVAAPAANLPQRTMIGYGVLPNDRSFVTFEVNGVQQWVSIGENVGSSGWTLVKVVDPGIATFRRNGIVREVAKDERL